MSTYFLAFLHAIKKGSLQYIAGPHHCNEPKLSDRRRLVKARLLVGRSKRQAKVPDFPR